MEKGQKFERQAYTKEFKLEAVKLVRSGIPKGLQPPKMVRFAPRSTALRIPIGKLRTLFLLVSSFELVSKRHPRPTPNDISPSHVADLGDYCCSMSSARRWRLTRRTW